MTHTWNYMFTTLFGILQLSICAMVLPRPPSSPNHIQHDQDVIHHKLWESKTMQSLLQGTNVKGSDADDYRFFEIELQRPDEVDTANLQSIVRAVLKQTDNESYPNPEVVPNSALGVRNVGLTPNLRVRLYDEDKHVLLTPSKLRHLDEKLYYLKNGRPKVYVNVRGHSGSYLKSLNPKTTSSESVGFLRVTEPWHRQTNWKLPYNQKNKVPKKYNRWTGTIESALERNRVSNSESSKPSDQAAAYAIEDYVTTQSPLVTSSELPKQIPAPPSKTPAKPVLTQTTPVQRYFPRRTEVLSGYAVIEEP